MKKCFPFSSREKVSAVHFFSISLGLQWPHLFACFFNSVKTIDVTSTQSYVITDASARTHNCILSKTVQWSSLSTLEGKPTHWFLLLNRLWINFLFTVRICLYTIIVFTGKGHQKNCYELHHWQEHNLVKQFFHHMLVFFGMNFKPH